MVGQNFDAWQVRFLYGFQIKKRIIHVAKPYMCNYLHV
jgi:hypothetical protein